MGDSALRTDEYLEPQKYYEHSLKEIHHQNVVDRFDELTKQSGVDVGANRITSDKYYKEEKVLEKLNRSLSGVIVGIVFMGILSIGGGIGGIITLIASINMSNGVGIGVGIGLIVVAIVALLLWIFVFAKKKKMLKAKVEEQQKLVDNLKREAYSQVAPLLKLITPEEPTSLFSKSAPLIEFDKYLSSKVEERLVKQFGEKLDGSTSHSTLVVQSGNINTNPFTIRQIYNQVMRDEIYTGTLVISYTRYVSDGEGGTKAVTVTETLTAHVTRPKPHYFVSTELNYYSDAAPKLSFARTPAGLSGKSDKEIDRIVDKKEKQEERKASKALKKGENYTKVANTKFEAYLNATGRDNEIEYRLLFTPLAQKNYCYSFASTSPFSDDIYFRKNKCINTVSSKHDAGEDYSGDISNYMHFDYDVIKDKFIKYNDKFFRNIYYDMIPLLNIPLYHQHQSPTYIPDNPNSKEVISFYKPADCDTNIILKVKPALNQILVQAFGFHADPRTELVPVMGGDGILHSVPVPYYEYLPVTDSKVVKLFNKDSNSLDNTPNSGINYKMFKAII